MCVHNLLIHLCEKKSIFSCLLLHEVLLDGEESQRKVAFIKAFCISSRLLSTCTRCLYSLKLYKINQFVYLFYDIYAFQLIVQILPSV